jgi:hypothetical protein
MSNNKQTPKEKAEELYVGYWYLTNDSRIAKQCALVAVDEILNVIDWHEFEVPNDQLEYWLEVKQEIETFGDNNEQAMIDYNKMEEEWEMENYNEMNNEQR